MLETLFPYQTAGAQWLATKEQALLADEMGLGKSAQAIHAADLIDARGILVICPASVRINWTREFARFSDVPRPVKVITTKKDPLPESGVVVISYDLAVPRAQELRARRWDVLILDEAHYLKDRSAQRTKAIYGRGTKYPGVIGSCARVWRLTGTPAPNNASELWVHLKTSGQTTDPYWDFTYRFCEGFSTDYGYRITGTRNVNELKGLLKPIMLRRKKDQVLTDLPPIYFQEVTVERTAVELDPEFYEDMLKVGGAEPLLQSIKVADQTLQAALATVANTKQPNMDRLGILEAMAPSLVTLRRFIAAAKYPAICDILEEELNANAYGKIVLFAVHKVVVENVRERLKKFHPVTLYGGTPVDKRQKNIDRFQQDPSCRVFVGNIMAAGTGITLTAANEVAFLEQDWVPSNNAQAAMRCHRIGQTKPVRVRVFSLAGSVDELVQQTLLRKTKDLTKIF